MFSTVNWNVNFINQNSSIDSASLCPTLQAQDGTEFSDGVLTSAAGGNYDINARVCCNVDGLDTNVNARLSIQVKAAAGGDYEPYTDDRVSQSMKVGDTFILTTHQVIPLQTGDQLKVVLENLDSASGLNINWGASFDGKKI